MADPKKIIHPKFKIFYIFFLVSVALLFSLGSTTIYPTIKDLLQTHNLTQKSIEEMNFSLISSLDGGMYQILKESLRSNVFSTSKSESLANLVSIGIDINSQEGRNLIYLAHTDRGRLLYPALILTLEPFFGNYSYLILNILAYTILVIFFLSILGIKKSTHIVMLLLAGSTVPIFIFSFMPEMCVYLFTTIYLYYVLSHFVDTNFHVPLKIFRKPLLAIIILIAVLLMKPVFIVLLAVQAISIPLCSKKLRVELFAHIGIALLFLLAWVISRASNKTPLEIGLAQNPIKALLSAKTIYVPENSLIPSSSIRNAYPTLISEVNAQITRLQNIPIIISILALIFALLYASLKLNVFLLSILFGTLLTQSHGGGLGTNYRSLNIFLIFTLLMIGFILNREDDKPNVN